MAKVLHVTIILIILCITLIQAQICRPLTVRLRPGQRICLRNCPPRPSTCITAVRDYKVQTCPSGCCRRGSGCVPLKKLG